MEIRTGYFAYTKKYKEMGYHCISIAQIKPKWFDGDFIYDFAPNCDLLYSYKNGAISEEDFKSKYIIGLWSIDCNKILNDLAKYDKVILLCYEKPEKFCHRHILAEYLNKNYGTSISELCFD